MLRFVVVIVRVARPGIAVPGLITPLVIGVERLLIEVAPLHLRLAPWLVDLDVIKVLLLLEAFSGGGLQLALLLLGGLTGTQLVFDGNQIDPVTLALLLFPARPTDAQFFQNTAVELFEFVFSALVNNDPVGTAADDFLHRHLPGGEDALPQQGNAKGSHHQGGELAGFDVESEAQHASELASGFRDHLAVDHPAVALGAEGFAQGIGGIHQDHVADLTDPIQGHPAGQARQEAGQGVVAQPKGHDFATVDIHDHFTHNTQASPGVAGDHLGAHQFGAQPEAITGHPCGEGVGLRWGRGQSKALGHGLRIIVA